MAGVIPAKKEVIIMNRGIERTEGQPGMSVKVPDTIVSPEVASHIVRRMPDLGFEARMENHGVSIPVVVFETPEARGVFTNVVNAVIDRRTDEDRIRAADAYVASRIQ
jgi:hypothetical protein